MLILEIAAGVALAPVLLKGGLTAARWLVSDVPVWWLGNRDWIAGAAVVLPLAILAALH